MFNIAINTHQDWPKVSDRILELMRCGAELGLELATSKLFLDAIEGVNFQGNNKDDLHNDPVMQAKHRRAIRASIIHWLNAIIKSPEQTVTPYAVYESVDSTAEMYQAQAAEILQKNAHAIQDVAWQYWMKIVFQLTKDSLELQQLLELSSISIRTYNEASLELWLERLELITADKKRGGIEEQRELVANIISGEERDLTRASGILNYSFKHTHHSAIVWSEEIDTEISTLENVATVFQKACQQNHSLKVIASPSVIWVWASAEFSVNEKILETVLKQNTGIRISFGSSSSGIDGFRRAYLDAQAAQRVLGRLESNIQLVSYERVRLMAFLSKDAKSIQHYSEHVLGELAHAPATVRQSLHAFLECGCNATEAAKKLHTHRNTLLRRLTKAEEMLPRPLADNRIQVAVALEALYWIL
jgi:DNA-binding PucR family transcriptional regulator